MPAAVGQSIVAALTAVVQSLFKRLLLLCSSSCKPQLQVVVLSDKVPSSDLDIKCPPIPTLLAVGAVHHHLIRWGPAFLDELLACLVCPPQLQSRLRFMHGR